MKTTIEIADALLGEAKRLARARHMPLRELLERGLRLALVEEMPPPVAYQPVVFGGEGLSPEFAGRGWEALSSAIYEDHPE
jgi:hypothetical protein